MKINVIKKTVDAPTWESLWRPRAPVIYILKPTVPTLSIWGPGQFSDYLNVEKVPKNFSLARREWHSNSGVIFRDKNMLSIIVHYPAGTKGVGKAYSDSVFNVLAKHGITATFSPHRKGSNDFVFEKDGKIKKFGAATDSRGILGSVLTLRFTAKKVNDIYKLDTDKFKRRGHIKHISDVVGGLKEINSKIGEKVVDEIINQFASTLGWQLIWDM